MSQKTIQTIQKKRVSHVYESRGEGVFQGTLIFIMVLLSITFLYPYWHVFVTSISSVDVAEGSGFKLWPSKLSFDAYHQMFLTKNLWTGYKNTLIVVVMGWAVSISLNILGAYSLSKKDLPFRGIFTGIIILTMFLQGGMIPTYLLVNNTLGMHNSYWAVILPQCVSVSHLVIMRNYFMNLPQELEEASIIDGANSFQVLIRVMLPLSVPMIATISLWVIVSNWNAYFNCLLYITDTSKYVLQIIMRRIIQTDSKEMTYAGEAASQLETDTYTLRSASIMLATLPIICVYPFLQKYFVKGVLVGSLKG
ncbi:MAG: carbohydrate ABC transporter permease [Clostridia bacterium]|nr:carbohydrate ABC transporter permease [Clostridia bacterium]